MARMLMLFGSLWFVLLSIVTIWRYINRSFLPQDLCENVLLFNLIFFRNVIKIIPTPPRSFLVVTF